MAWLAVPAGRLMNARLLQIAAYGLATLIQALSGFLVVPVVLRLGGKEVFAQWSLLEPLLTYGATIALLGANFGLIKLIGIDRLSPADAVHGIFRKVLLQVALAFFLALAAVLVIYRDVVLAAGVALFVGTEALFVFYQAALRGGNKAQAYAAGSIGKFAVILTLCYLMLYAKFDSLALRHLVMVYLAGSLAGLLVSWQFSRSNSGSVLPESATYSSALRYGLPMMLASVLAGVVAVGDRYVVGLYLGLSEIAVYVAILKLVNVLNMAATPLNLWFPAARYVHARDPDGGDHFFYRVLVAALTAFLMIAGVLYFMGPVVFLHFAPGLAWDPVLAGFFMVAGVAAALSVVVNIGLLSEGKTHYMPIILGVIAILQVLSLLMLTPAFGARGAGASLAAAQLASLVIIFNASQRIHRINWPLHRVALMLAGFLAAFMLALDVVSAPFLQAILFVVAFLAVALLLEGKAMVGELAGWQR